MKQLSYLLILAIIGGVVYATLNQEDKTVRNFQFTYNVDLEKNEEGIVEVWIPIPQNIKNVQKIDNMTLDYNKALLTCEELIEKKHKNKYFYCKSNEESLKKNTSITLTCDVERKEHKRMNYEGVKPENYLDANRMVPKGEVFQAIIDEEKLTSLNIEKVYEYVLSGMHYGKPTKDIENKNYKYYDGKNSKTGKEWLPNDINYGRLKKTKDEVVAAQDNNKEYAFGNGNANYACDIGVGNCTDYHSYFMSLCRTLEVPARFHMGFNIPPDEKEDGQGKVGGYHCWADYYKEGRGWFPVDISEADKDPKKARYFFGTLDKNRVEFTTGRDLELKHRESPENFFIYPLVEGTKYEKSFKYKNL